MKATQPADQGSTPEQKPAASEPQESEKHALTQTVAQSEDVSRTPQSPAAEPVKDSTVGQESSVPEASQVSADTIGKASYRPVQKNGMAKHRTHHFGRGPLPPHRKPRLPHIPGLSAKFRKQVFQMFLTRQRVQHPYRILRGRTVARPQHRERSLPPRRNTVLARREKRRLTHRAFVCRVPLRGVLQYPPRRNLVFQSLHRLTNLSHGILAPPSDSEKHAVNKHFR